ncbi:MAG: dihydrolipoyl dehydrogenase, partial [Zetaproteobacteria bacterium]|nr:dihydrolipoyl dehydrogenase [Zetaproteobacteria bacterium]
VGAIRAAHLGLKVVLIENRPHLGGTCLNVGCIPTKALIESAKTWSKLKQLDHLGFKADKIAFQWDKILQRKGKIVDAQRKGLRFLMKKNKITVLEGTAEFVSPTEIKLTTGKDKGTQISAQNTLIATGSKVRNFPLAQVNGKTIHTSDTIMDLPAIPKRIAIIGGGVIGMEFASLFCQFGSAVSVYEMASQVVPFEDPECAQELVRYLKKDGVQVHTGVKVSQIEEKKQSVVVSLEGGNSAEFDILLLSTGRVPVTEGMQLEKIGVQVNPQGFIGVDSFYRTNRPNIFAIGDCINTPALAHTASAEAKLAVEVLTGKPRNPINYRFNPSAIYTYPEIASIGAGEAELQEEQVPYQVAKFPFAPMAKAKIEEATTGFIKIFYHTQSHELLGVHIVGAKATELISEFVLGAQLETTIDEIGHAIHPHPTIAETIMEAGHMVDGQAIHM